MTNIQCPVCRDFNTEPQSLKPCGHIVCLECLKKSKEIVMKCPVCEQVVKKHKTDTALQTIVNDWAKNSCTLHFGHRYFSICKVCNVPVCENCLFKKHSGHILMQLDETNKKEIKSRFLECCVGTPNLIDRLAGLIEEIEKDRISLGNCVISKKLFIENETIGIINAIKSMEKRIVEIEKKKYVINETVENQIIDKYLKLFHCSQIQEPQGSQNPKD
ncbi:hypothetical protein ACTA71_009254 [Dictyostelium dimigraforme]